MNEQLQAIQSQLTNVTTLQENTIAQLGIICTLLNDIVNKLNQEGEGSLIDELSELFAPLFKDVQMIKNHLNIDTSIQELAPHEVAPSATDLADFISNSESQ